MDTNQNVMKSPMVLVDCTGRWVNSSLLEMVKTTFPNCDSYVCCKMDYVTSPESEDINRSGFNLVSAGTITSVLEPIKDLHFSIKDYYVGIKKNMDVFNMYHDAFFIKHDLSVLDTEEGSNYIIKTIAENLYERNIVFDWNETNRKAVLEICKIMKDICCV